MKLKCIKPTKTLTKGKVYEGALLKVAKTGYLNTDNLDDAVLFVVFSSDNGKRISYASSHFESMDNLKYTEGLQVVECGSCKYFEQGKSCSFCGHPQQPNKDFKQYLYYNFTCSLHEQGVAQSRIDYMKTCPKDAC